MNFEDEPKMLAIYRAENGLLLRKRLLMNFTEYTCYTIWIVQKKFAKLLRRYYCSLELSLT